MASGIDFKTVDPVAQLIASGSGGGGGGGLPLTGGTLTGDLTLQVPAKVVHCQPPVGPCDLTNKQYVDGLIGGGPFLPLAGGNMLGAIAQPVAPVNPNDLVNKTYVDSLPFQAKKPTAVLNNIAVFGGGADLGQTIDSGVQINDLVVGANTLFTSDKTMSQIRKAFFVISNTVPTASIAPAATVNLFINNAQIGPSNWPVILPNDGTTFSVNGSGVVSITNPDTENKTYRITFISGGMDEQSGPPALYGIVEIQFFDETGPPVQVGLTDRLICLASATLPQFVNKVVNTITVNVGPTTPDNVFSFSVRATNLTATNVILDPDAPLFDSSKLVIERIC
jgi:hypothetical protein